ncbi:MAG: hypothetical protein MJ180_01310 [Candidatus Gastranaerophilales bacterium]|nr:hypothetical protein [Candidatus Gastranaerophilales bacterium]
MGIVIRKKPKFQKKKIIKKIIILFIIYLVTFSASFFFFNKNNINKNLDKKKTVIVYANDGEKFLSEKKYSQAIEYYMTQLNQNPEDYVSMTQLGLAYKNLEQYDKAKFYLYKSYQISPTYRYNYIYAAQIYIAEKNYEIAESTIDAMPTSSKEDFLAKADLLIKLSREISDLEEKIVYYRRAVSYYKKYDKTAFNETLDELINLYFKLAEYYKSKGDISNIKSLYSSIIRYKDNCEMRNIIAMKYKAIAHDTDAILNITQAVNQAETQEEKRLTRKNLIDLKYYFEQKANNKNIKIINSLLDILDEETILVDENHTALSVTNEDFKYIKDKKKKKILPVLTLKIKNKSDKPVTPIYLKAEIYFHHKKVLETEKLTVIPPDITLEPNKETDLITINFDNEVKKNKLKYYTVGLSLSDDNMNWKLYRIYQADKISK